MMNSVKMLEVGDFSERLLSIAIFQVSEVLGEADFFVVSYTHYDAFVKEVIVERYRSLYRVVSIPVVNVEKPYSWSVRGYKLSGECVEVFNDGYSE